MLLPPMDPDKAAAGFVGEEATRVKRLLALQLQIGLLIPKAQQFEHKHETARLEFEHRQKRFEAGVISEHDLALARADLKAAERALKLVEDTRTQALADFQKEAAEFASAYKGTSPTEAEYKKLMAEYDALTVRLVKTEVGRLLAVIPPPPHGRGDSDIVKVVGNERLSVGSKLLDLRDEIYKQSSQAARGITSMNGYRENVRTIENDPKEAKRVDEIRQLIQETEQQIKFRTEAVRGMLVDFKKLADEIDPPGEPKKVIESKGP